LGNPLSKASYIREKESYHTWELMSLLESRYCLVINACYGLCTIYNYI